MLKMPYRRVIEFTVLWPVYVSLYNFEVESYDLNAEKKNKSWIVILL